MVKSKIFVVLGVVLLILIAMAAGYFGFKKINQANKLAGNTTSKIQYANPQKQIPIQTPSYPPPPKVTPLPIPNAQGGQITCNLQIQATTDRPGAAFINAAWNQENTNICFSTNGGAQKPLISDVKASDSVSIPFSALNLGQTYVFTLFAHKTADPVCTGAVLSSCPIGQ